MKIELELSDEAVVALAAPIAEHLRELMKAAPAPGAERYLTRRQAAEMGVESRALRRAESTGELEAFKPGKTVVYRREDVLALVERSRVQRAPAALRENVKPLDPWERARARADRRKRGR